MFFIRFFRMASLVMLLVAVALLSAITTMHFAIHGAEVQVPALKGMTVLRRAARPPEWASTSMSTIATTRPMSPQGTSCRNRLRRAPSCVANGMCASQRALARRKLTCPTRWAPMQRVAALRLRRAGLEVGVTAKLPDDGVEEGTVIAQDPPAHAQGIERPSVNLLVAAPDDDIPDGYVMPDLTGLPIVTAQAELAQSRASRSTLPSFVDVPVPLSAQETRHPSLLSHPAP